MYVAVSQNLLEGVLRPRASFRRILNLDCGGRDIGLMVLFSYLLKAIFTLILLPGDHIAITGAGHAFGVFASAIEALILGWLAWFPPRIFGGKGRWRAALQASAWLLILMSILSPLLILAIGMFSAGGDLNEILQTEGSLRANGIPPAALGLLAVCGGWYMWLFSAMIAEIHKFEKTWMVAAAIIGVVLVLSMLLTR